MKMSSEEAELSALSLQRYTLSGETMGTRYSAVFFAPSGLDEPAIGAGLFAAVDKVDRQMSTWKPDSDLSRLNAMPEQQWLAVPEELVGVLATALRIGLQSDGAFDIGVGDLVNAWGFGPSGSAARCTADTARCGAGASTGNEALEIDQAKQPGSQTHGHHAGSFRHCQRLRCG